MSCEMWLTRRQIADLYEVDPGTVRSWARRGRG